MTAPGGQAKRPDGGPAADTRQAAAGKGNAVGNPEQRIREFIGFFGSLVGLVGFGLGMLPDSTAMEKFIVSAVALSCVVTLAIKLVPKGRAAAWLAVSGAVFVAGCTCRSRQRPSRTMPPRVRRPAAAQLVPLQH